MPSFKRAFAFIFNPAQGPADRLIGRWLFLRALGLIYFSAFFALLFQVRGLNGSQGILPVSEYLQQVHRLGGLGWWFAPSLLWLNSSDTMLSGLIWVGLLASLLVFANIWPRASLLVCFVCFLSFVSTAQDFSMYQSDGMLLEAGFLAVFVAPAGRFPGWGRNSLASRAALFLLLWEWFRIYFQSGAVKLLSGDPTWRNLTAMYEYYQNGPLPTWVGWYLQHLPLWFHRWTAGATLFMELVLVWMAFLPRRWRLACFFIVTVWQAGVIATANYAFLNYLVLILAFLLLDDRSIARFVPRRWRGGLDPGAASTLAHEPEPAASRTEAQEDPWQRLTVVRTAAGAVALTLIAYVTTAQAVLMFWHAAPLPTGPVAWLDPFRIANSYGLFANMTPHRYEVEFQGSDDGVTWTAYPFRYKPQNPADRPRIYAPYQPRFDWNLWFASLEPWEQSPIVPLTERRLLQGDKDVLGLFAGNPFAGHPPKQVRAVLWQYWFSTPEEKRAHGVWWRRQMLGTFAPTVRFLPDGRMGELAEPDLQGPPAS